MSAICGLIDFAAAPPVADLQPMADAIASYGRDGVSTAARGNAAFAFLLSRNVPEDAFEAQPEVLADGRLFATWARLHNRSELLAKLGLPAAEGRATADGRLLRLAFERWGADCLQHLVGQFALAVWDPAERALLLACDHMGETSLYVTRRGSRFAFASHPAAVFALSDCPRELDEVAFADFLAGHHAAHHRTLFVGVDRLPSGTALRVTASDARRIDYWDLENLKPRRWRDPDEMFEAFEEQMEAATQARLRTSGEVGLLLSGGLDSGLVAGFAAPRLREAGRALHTYTLRPLPGRSTALMRGRVDDEKPFVDALAALHPNIEPCFSDESLPHFLAGLEHDFAALYTPPLGATQSAWVGAGMRRLAGRGAGIVLQAQRGNFTVSWWGIHPLAELLFGGQWMRLVAELRARRQRTGASFYRLVRPLLGELRGIGINLRDDLVGRPMHAWLYRPLLGLLQPDWRRQTGLEPRLAGEFKRGVGRPRLDGRGFRMRAFENAGYRRHQDLFQRMLAPLGVEGSDVTADRRLVEFSLQLQDADFLHRGWNRSLARFGCGQRLPDRVRWRTNRGLQPIDALRYSWREADRVSATLADLRADPQVTARLDVDAMQRLWQQLLAERGDDDAWQPANPGRALNHVNHFHNLLAAGRFLQWLRTPPRTADASPVDDAGQARGPLAGTAL